MTGSDLDSNVDLLASLVRDLERRLRMEDGPARQQLDYELADLADQVAQALYKSPRGDEPPVPPRRVAVAMGLALQSAPHFVATFQVPVRDGTLDATEPARRSAQIGPIVGDDVYERILGLVQWEVDELREEVDRRAGKALKHVRTLNWLWSFFSMPAAAAPSTLARVLVPGLEDVPIEVVRRGGHLYLVVDTAVSPLSAMFLPWLARDPNFGPGSFQSRGVDRGLRSRLSRGVGGDDEEVAELLEEMVTIVPKRSLPRYLHLDQWRSCGYAVVTDLGTPYTAGNWLTKPLPPDAADWRAWLKIGPTGAIVVRGTAEKVFDALALPRVTAMTRQLYASMLASLGRESRHEVVGVRPEDVDLYDLPRHMRAVLSPLLSWAGKSSTHKFVANELGREVEEVTVVLEQVREAWTAHSASSWMGPPGTKTPSIQTLLLEHLITLHDSVRRLVATPSDPRGDHADLLLLFVAHYLREARLERLWVKSLSDCADGAERLPPPEDIAGTWFWRVWLKLLDEIETDGGGPTGGEET